jgi:hypothetical protein
MVKTRSQTVFESEKKAPPGILLPICPRDVKILTRNHWARLPRKIFQVGEGHPLHGRSMAGGTSKFEFLAQEILMWWVYTLSVGKLGIIHGYQIPHFLSGHRNLTVDCCVTADGLPFFAAEFDGAHHYKRNSFYKHGEVSRSWEYQMKRDRYVEDTLLHGKMTVFRIPYTIFAKGGLERLVNAGEYVVKALERDRRDKVCRIHYLDFDNSYAMINTTRNVEIITGERSADDPTVLTRVAVVVE